MNLSNQILSIHQKAAIKHDLKLLLMDWLRFKLYIQFKAKQGNFGATHTLWGAEHSCTYNQCLLGHVKEIILNRENGYRGLVDLVERRYVGKFVKAVIYGRNSEWKTDIIHRRWYQGEPEPVNQHGELENQPIFSDENLHEQRYKILNYQIISGMIIIKEEKTVNGLDWGTEISKQLNK